MTFIGQNKILGDKSYLIYTGVPGININKYVENLSSINSYSDQCHTLLSTDPEFNCKIISTREHFTTRVHYRVSG